jgi:hypothetical protein
LLLLLLLFRFPVVYTALFCCLSHHHHHHHHQITKLSHSIIFAASLNATGVSAPHLLDNGLQRSSLLLDAALLLGCTKLTSRC